MYILKDGEIALLCHCTLFKNTHCFHFVSSLHFPLILLNSSIKSIYI